MKIDLHINFPGNCQEAFVYYQSILGGEVQLLTYGDSQSETNVPEDWKYKIVHGSIKLNQLEIAGTDVPPDAYEAPRGFQLLLQLNNEAESRRIFDALSENGSITMPLQKTFWSPCFGIVVDKFGIAWEINYAST